MFWIVALGVALARIFHTPNETQTVCRGVVARHSNVETVTAQRLLDIGMSSYGSAERACEISGLVVGAAGLAADAKPKTSPSPSLNIGEMLYHARCLYCHDLPSRGSTDERWWNRWMARMRYTAGLSVFAAERVPSGYKETACRSALYPTRYSGHEN